MYTHEQFANLIAETVQTINKLSKLKGDEYAHGGDRLDNFRRAAKDLNLPLETIWRVYCGKHWDAITQYVNDVQLGKTRERLESITSRADDIIVYMILFKAMVEERETPLSPLPPEEFGKIFHKRGDD